VIAESPVDAHQYLR